MKASICPNCQWYSKTTDPLFPVKVFCGAVNRELTGQTITQCKHFKEAEQ